MYEKHIKQKYTPGTSRHLNLVMLLLIIVNVVGIFVIKDGWVTGDFLGEKETGWTAQISKVLYGVVILLMLPSFVNKYKELSAMRLCIFLIFISIIFAFLNHTKFDFGRALKPLLVFISFLYFNEKLKTCEINIHLLTAFILIVSFQIAYRIILANQLSTSIESGQSGTGHGASVTLILLLPLVCYLWKPKSVGYFYLFALIFSVISLRRTSILVILLCFPFIYSYLKEIMTRKVLIIMLTLLAVMFFYVINNYWFIIEARFSDMFTPSRSGEYGSGRTGWYADLWNSFWDSKNILVYLFGFGQGSVAACLHNNGYVFDVAHNDYLEILYTYGWIGLFTYYGTIIFLAFQAIKRNPKYKKIVIMAVVAVMGVGAVTGTMGNQIIIAIPLFLCLVKYRRGISRKLKVTFH